MALFALSYGRSTGSRPPRFVESICLAVLVADVVFLAGSYFTGMWLVAQGGGGVVTDFVNVWAAGRLVLGGHAATAHDWPTHKLAENGALGHAFDGYYGWHYPPPFLFVAAALASLPYTFTFLAWTAGTFLMYLVAIRTIVGDRVGYLLAAAFPSVLANFFVGQNGFLSAALFGGTLIRRLIANDFVNVMAAGRLTLAGEPVAAYDWPRHKQAEVRAIGHDFEDYYGWHYPPTFLFVAAALATLPYLTAAIGWLAATICACVAAIAGTLGRRTGVLVALGFPAEFWNITAGQNGFLTAALIGCTLSLLQKRPALAGVCLGLLTYKPQFGLLFPLVLIADRRWLTIAVAALVAVGLAAASWLAFGTASWETFLHWMPITSGVVLTEGQADWNRLQSLFGLVRPLGGSEQLAWTVQAVGSLAVAVAVIGLWRSRASFDLKAAALAAGTLVVTPYLVYVRSRRTRRRRRVFAALRAGTGLSHQRDRRTWHRRNTHPDLPLRQDPGRARCGVDRAGVGDWARAHSGAVHSAGTITGVGAATAKPACRPAMICPIRRAATIANAAIATPAMTSMK